MQSETLFRSGRGATMLGALALTACGALAGCGGSSSSSSLGPAGNFIGRWELDGTTSTFSINCPTSMLSGAAAIWVELVFDHGVLSDLSETSGACLAPGIAFDVDSKGTVATVSNPDPYTGMAPVCSLVIGNDTAGLPVYLDLTFTNLTFTSLAAVKDQAPTALLSGTATGAIVQDDGSGMGRLVQTDTCTYSGTADRYHRMSRP
jgi:hypothetical protein